MKKIISFSLLFLYSFITVIACELCKSHQPEMLKDIAHGTGPQGTTDYIIMWTGVAIVVITLILSLAFLILPNKLDKNYSIKYLPVNENH